MSTLSLSNMYECMASNNENICSISIEEDAAVIDCLIVVFVSSSIFVYENVEIHHSVPLTSSQHFWQIRGETDAKHAQCKYNSNEV